MDPKELKLDWGKVREQGKGRATRDVKASLLLDKIAEREAIGATQEEIDGDDDQHEYGQDELGQEGEELVEVVHRRIGPTTAGSGR